jgi:PRC-barrel domain
MQMESWFALQKRLSRVAAGYQRNRLATLQLVGGALAIVIATAAQPSTGQPPSSASGFLPEQRAPAVLVADPDVGTYDSTQTPADQGLRLEQIAQAGLFRILGKEVQGASGEDMGRIIDVLFDPTGRPRAAIIDFGGFLGVGSRKIAIDWSTLRFAISGRKETVFAALNRDQIRAAPEYKDSHDIVAVVTPARPEASDRGW